MEASIAPEARAFLRLENMMVNTLRGYTQTVMSEWAVSNKDVESY